MLRTEEEARKCWCPFARTPFVLDGQGGSIPANRYGSGDAASNAQCIASECMAWRWCNTDQPYEYKVTTDDTLDRALVVPPGDGWELVRKPEEIEPEDDGRWKVVWRRLNAKRRGYCGLAGAPA